MYRFLYKLKMDVYTTNEAKFVLTNYFIDKNIVFIGEYLSHDGYDQFGPKSDLWDLFIIEDLGTRFILYEYYWENWFTTFQNKEYDFLKKTNLEDSNLDELEKIIYKLDKRKNKNIKLYNLVKKYI